MTEATDNEFLELSNAFIELANKQLTSTNHTKVGMALVAAAARFNAYLVTAATGSVAAAKAESPKALAILTGKFEQSLKANLADYTANFERYSGNT